MSDIVSQTVGWVAQWLPAFPSRSVSKVAEVERIIVREVHDMIPTKGQIFVRLAGISGAFAVALGAYGAHAFQQKTGDERLKITFDTGNRYHFMHSIALLAVPLTRRPMLVGTLMCAGTLLFSGSCYMHALTGNTTIRRVTPYGGMLLIAAWVAMIF